MRSPLCDGFFIGPALQHYRCYHVWATATASMRVSDTLAWFPHTVTMPHVTPLDHATAAITDLAKALRALSAVPALSTSAQPHPPRSLAEELRDVIDMYLPPLPLSPPAADAIDTTSSNQRVSVTPPHPPTLSAMPTTPREQRVPTSVPAIDHSPSTQSTPHAESHSPDTPLCAANTSDSTSPAIQPLPNPHNLAPDGSPLTYRAAKHGIDAPHWLAAESAEFDRLFASHTLRPIHLSDQHLPRRADTTYYNPQTKEKRDSLGNITYRIRSTAGGDRINYDGPTSAFTATMPAIKLLIHSVISDDAKWMTVDIKDYYLSTPFLRPENVRVPCSPTRYLHVRTYMFVHRTFGLFSYISS